MNQYPPSLGSHYVARVSFDSTLRKDIITVSDLLQNDADAFQQLPQRLHDAQPGEHYIPWGIVGIYATYSEAEAAIAWVDAAREQS